MTCKFDPNKCSVECSKYSMCAYYSIQTQISEIQSQLNFLYTSISSVLDKIQEIDLKSNMLNDAFIREKNKNTEESVNEKEYQ